MAADIYSENLIIDFISPRLSFSNDLENDNHIIDDPCRLDHSLADSTLDFAFVVDPTTSIHTSTADELFSNGNIIPISFRKDNEKEEEEVEEEITTEPMKVMPTLKSCLDQTSPEEKKKSLKEFLQDSIEEDEEVVPNTSGKSFWMFRRSSSLNCDRNPRLGFTGFPKIISRSSSTSKYLEKVVEQDDHSGRKSFWKFSRNNSLKSESAPNVNCKVLRYYSTNNHCENVDYRQKVKPFRRSSSLNCETRKGVNNGLVGSSDKFLPRSYSSGYAPKKHEEQFIPMSANAGQKKQVKSNLKGYGYGNYNGNVKVSSVLNLPSPYISRVSVDLFGFRMFCNGIGKDKKKRK